MPIESQQEHARCIYYDRVEFPLIKIHKFSPIDSISNTMRNSQLIFIMEGNVHYSMGNQRNKEAQKGDCILIPQGWTIELNIGTDCIIMAFRLLNRVSFCECYMIEQLYDDRIKKATELPTDSGENEQARASSEHSHEPVLLKVNTPIWNYLWSLYSSISDGLECRNYFEVKIKELFFLLRAYYPKEQLYQLFNPVTSPDTLFSDYVRANYRNHKTVVQLASSMNLSQSVFARKFTKIFNKPPYQWIMEQKSEAIYAELTRGTNNLKHIASDFGFTSMTQFNDFCKDRWGRAPGSIRKTPLAK